MSRSRGANSKQRNMVGGRVREIGTMRSAYVPIPPERATIAPQERGCTALLIGRNLAEWSTRIAGEVKRGIGLWQIPA